MRKTITSLFMFLPVLLLAQDKSSSSSDGSEAFALFLVAVLFVGYEIYRYFHKRKCPFCKKNMALELVDEVYLGVAKTKNEKQSDGTYATVYYNKIKYVRQCKYCGGTVNEIKIVKGE